MSRLAVNQRSVLARIGNNPFMSNPFVAGRLASARLTDKGTRWNDDNDNRWYAVAIS